MAKKKAAKRRVNTQKMGFQRKLENRRRALSSGDARGAKPEATGTKKKKKTRRKKDKR